MNPNTLQTIRLGLGVAMLGLGTYLLARLFVGRLPPLTPSWITDTMFAVFFIARGLMNLWMRSRRLKDSGSTDSGSTDAT